MAGGRLQMDDEGAYFHSRIPGDILYDLWRAPFSGTPAKLLSGPEIRSMAFSVLGNHVYFVSAQNAIARMAKTPENPGVADRR